MEAKKDVKTKVAAVPTASAKVAAPAKVTAAPIAPAKTVAPVAPAKVAAPAKVTTHAASAEEKADIRVAKKGGAKIKMNGIPATGRRKKSIARVRLITGGTGKITINNKTLDEYFVNGFLKLIVNQPLKTANVATYDFVINIHGGGLTGQAGAIRHGIARALIKQDEQLKSELKKAGYLKRDPRMKERKKYGLKKARRAPQFSKR